VQEREWEAAGRGGIGREGSTDKQTSSQVLIIVDCCQSGSCIEGIGRAAKGLWEREGELGSGQGAGARALDKKGGGVEHGMGVCSDQQR